MKCNFSIRIPTFRKQSPHEYGTNLCQESQRIKKKRCLQNSGIEINILALMTWRLFLNSNSFTRNLNFKVTTSNRKQPVNQKKSQWCGKTHKSKLVELKKKSNKTFWLLKHFTWSALAFSSMWYLGISRFIWINCICDFSCCCNTRTCFFFIVCWFFSARP